MNRERQARKSGEEIILGGVKYYIEGLEGCGGNSIVYRASYRDELNRESFHQVLIKELYPFSRQGEVWRNDEGCIVTNKDGREFMESARESFVQGNQANLILLAQDPEQVSGNLNSYEAYGTCYSVLTLHGGKSLEKRLAEGKYRSLAAAAEAMLKILDALECFHKEGILHLDISPDNILMLKKQALLIDYNSTWRLNQPEDAPFYFWEKPGYSAPEIYLREKERISPSTDLYSVCAVFFQMVTGRKMDTEECWGKGLKKSFPKSLECFQGQPVTACYKAVEILTKGLNILNRKRYQSIEELRNDVKELIARIEGKGISVSAIWENSRSAWLSQKNRIGQYLPRTISMDSREMIRTGNPFKHTDTGELLSEEDCFGRLSQGAEILLKGTGGLGKTQYLYRLWEAGVKKYHPKAPVVFYIPLEDYQQSGEEAGYIRHFMLRKLKFTEETNSMEDALHELNLLFEKAGQQTPCMILLLDGLNEAGNKRERLIREIEELGKYSGVGILVSDRTDSVKQYGLREFQTAGLLPLEEDAVKRELAGCCLECPKEKKLQELLRNPMMLYLYISASMMSKENGGEEQYKVPQSLEEMVGFYLENLKRLQKRRDSGNEAGQLAHDYLLEHLLPAIAGEMKKRKKTVLSTEELYGLLCRDYRSMNSKVFGLAFPKYLGKSRLILQGIANDREWFDYAVSEQLIEKMNLLEQTAEGNYSLIHDNFVEYLAGQLADNQRIWKNYHKKYVFKRGIAVLLAVVVLSAGSVAVYRKIQPSVKTISEKERKELESVTLSLNGNVGCWDGMIQSQYKILEAAQKEEVLENTVGGRENLRKVMEKAEENMNWYYTYFYQAPVQDGKTNREYDYLDTVISIFPKIAKEDLSKVYTEAEVQKYNLKLCMDFLQNSLIEEGSEEFCDKKEDRETILEIYDRYLKASIEYYYLIYNKVYISLDEETQAELKKQINQTSSFSAETRKWSLGTKTEKELEDMMHVVQKADNSDLKTVQLDMAGYGFPVSEMKWPF